MSRAKLCRAALLENMLLIREVVEYEIWCSATGGPHSRYVISSSIAHVTLTEMTSFSALFSGQATTHRDSPVSSPPPEPQDKPVARSASYQRVHSLISRPRHAADIRHLIRQHTTWSRSATARASTTRSLCFVIVCLACASWASTTHAVETSQKTCRACRLYRSLIRYLFIFILSTLYPHTFLLSLPESN
jgi:hypothetical protein